MSYFPPQNLGEVKKGSGDLRSAKVLVSLSPQMQIDRSVRPGTPGASGLASKPEAGFYYDRFLEMLRERLAAQGARPVTELRDMNDLAAPKLPQVIESERPDYVLRLTQERMGLINAQQASVVWLLQLGRVTPRGVDLLFEHHYSVAGSYCLGSKLREFAEPTAMQCLARQAEHVVARLEANNFFNGLAAPAARQGGAAGLWSEPPPTRPVGGPGTGSSLCQSQAPGVRCP